MQNDQKISRELKNLADYIDKRLKEITDTDDYSFSLVIFNPIQGERLNYISNHNRKEVAAVWKTLITAWDKGMLDIPTHEIN